MSKNIGIVIILVLLLAAGGGAYFLSTQKPSGSILQDTGNSNVKSNSGIAGSIRDALTGSSSLECNFTDDEGRSTVSYVKNGAVRANITSSNPQESSSIIVKDDTMYFWNMQKQGFKTNLAAGSTSPMGESYDDNEDESQNGAVDADDVIDAMEKYKDSCKQANVSDSEFIPPSDVTFNDFSSMMNPQNNSLNESGDDENDDDAVIDPKAIEEMMRQYNQ